MPDRSEEEVVLQINNTLLCFRKQSFTEHLGSSVLLPDGSLEYIFLQPNIKTRRARPIVEIKFSKLQVCGKFFSAPDVMAKEKMFSDLFKEPWRTDSFHFAPCGFSLNALRPEINEWYATIHVTPEPGFSYVSFETNYLEELSSQIKKMWSLFCPEEAIITFQFVDTFPCDFDQYDYDNDKNCDNPESIKEHFSGLDFELRHFKKCFVENQKVVFYSINLLPTNIHK